MEYIYDSLSCKSKCSFITKTPIFAGVSTLLFIYPAFSVSYGGWTWFIQSIIAFMSDLWTAGKTSIWHPIDNVYVQIAVFIAFKRSCETHGFILSVLYALTPLLTYRKSMHSIYMKDEVRYNIWHGLWHIFGCIGLILSQP